LFKPGERSFHDPALRHDFKRMGLGPARDLDGGTVQIASDGIGEILALVTAIAEHAFNPIQLRSIAPERNRHPRPVVGIGPSHVNDVWQPAGIDADMTLDAADLLAPS
jgi:hypothetical protein